MSPLKQGILSIVLVALAAAGWYVYQNPQMVGLARESAGEAGGQAAARGENRIPGLVGGAGAVNVITATVETDQGGERVVALGTAKAARSVILYPQVTAMVTELLFKPGETVEAGAVLVRLEDDEQRVALDRARIALAQSEESLTRAEALAQSKTISSAALSEARMTTDLAKNDVRSAEIALERRLVTAPFAGVIGLTDTSVGDLVSNSTAITTLDDLTTVRVGFEVPERWAGRIVEGQAIVANAQGLPGSHFAGKIAGIDNRVDETTRTLRLEAELTNWGQLLKAGMAITVVMEFPTDEELAVPSLAVQWDRRGSFVWKVREGAARRADVAVVKRESGIVIVNGDLVAGDKVVVEGTQRLRDGAKVNEVDESPAMVEDGEGGAVDEVPAVSGTGAPARTRG